MRLTTLLRRLLGVTQMYVKRDVRGSGRPRYDRQPVARVAASVMGPDAGVAAVCAVAGVVPALPRGEGGAGAVGERQRCIHVGVRGIGGVSGAGDGPDGGEPACWGYRG